METTTYAYIKNLTTGETHYYAVEESRQRWDAFGRVSNQPVLEEMTKEAWTEEKEWSEFLASLTPEDLADED